MSVQRWLAGAMVAVWLLVPAALASAGPQARPKPPEVQVKPKAGVVRRQGDAYCFDRPMSLGNVVIAGGRCYTFYLLRNSGGSFLAFGPPGPRMIPPGQLVRMGTPAGAKLKGRLFYTVPLPRPVTTIPVGAIRFANVRIVPEQGRIVIYIPGITAGGSTERDLEMAFMQR
ncbi:MAG: hypothetical protein RDU83_04870 [bacterium]|nr:hypothetical protein [bacterium]